MATASNFRFTFSTNSSTVRDLLVTSGEVFGVRLTATCTNQKVAILALASTK